MSQPSKADVVRELHSDLARKYKRHAAAIENIWRSFDSSQRAKCAKAGAAGGVVLKHRRDQSMGNVCMVIPEYNLREMTESGPDFCLDLLKHRATKSPFEQYCGGVNGGLGDHLLIEEMVHKEGLRHTHPFKDCYTMFMDGPQYGWSFEVTGNKDEVMAPFQPAIRARLCLPQSVGELVLERQMYMMQGLTILIDDILDQGSKTRDRKQKPKRSDNVATEALSKLNIRGSPPKPTLPDLIASAQDQQESQREFLNLLTNEPTVLAHAVNIWFFSRPELLPDEKGRRLPVHTDKYTSASTFEAVHSSIKDAAIWKYLARLLGLLNISTADKTHRTLVLQELSNICQLELTRAQALFKRYVQIGTGSKWFKRNSNSSNSGKPPQATIKGNLENLLTTDPRLYYMLRLCQPKLSVSNATNWIKKLSEILDAKPMQREDLTPQEVDSLGELAIIIGFIQDVSSVFPLPPFSKAKEQTFVSKWEQLETELNGVKDQIDLRDFVVPIDNLLEPGMAEGALKSLDQFTSEKTGSTMGYLYQDLIEDCLSDLAEQYEKIKTKSEQELKAEKPTPSAETSQSAEDRVQQRRQKEKTRPPHSSIYDIATPAETSGTEEQAPPQNFKVDPSTAEIFLRLFNRSQIRSPVSWAAFEAAMGKLGFSVFPKYGSVYTFYPPSSMPVKRPFTIHRPHKSAIEGYRILLLSRRLKTWYIPPQWLQSSSSVPTTIVDAARLASDYAISNNSTIAYSNIPLLVHQQWSDTNISNWPDSIRQGAETWLKASMADNMAYFLWTGDGKQLLLDLYEPSFKYHFESLPRDIERSDVFRVLAVKWFGGIYADIDTQLLRPPISWLEASDLTPWTEPSTNKTHPSVAGKDMNHHPIRAIFGLEADCNPNEDTFWRSGYYFPIQLTQWAFAAGPGHPVLSLFISQTSKVLHAVSVRNQGNLRSDEARQELMAVDPLVLTGPAAITGTVKGWLEEREGLYWNSLTGLVDGGRSKRVGDVVVLPITGFSPGPPKRPNKGRKPITDPSARLYHQALGSWRKFHLIVEYGKFCRTPTLQTLHLQAVARKDQLVMLPPVRRKIA
ncbi:hypothetical protein P170DRAFT_512426 [Aspergillus steynii IBT 23096]|uniref:Glycosyl transferase n=1 Tax=Aspergillus steynii IBT 23096 TaxID=1392250 RepID=A0A2I2FYT1_9EURO|nr:uncharacterized protein P170DRAFT_512426 [Aspergillus steynii IBT 23096]PLB45801.1 hypothetical protein P170DRAFT_512426 [Aspergillus steynii IBT 23096]